MEPHPLQIGLDSNGTVIDTQELKSRIAQELFGVTIAPQHFRRSLIRQRRWLTAAQLAEVRRQVYKTPSFCRAQPIAGAAAGLAALDRAGHRSQIITSGQQRYAYLVRCWYRQRHLTLPVVLTGSDHKAAAAAGLDVMVDDDIRKLLPLVGAVPHLFLFSSEANAYDGVPPPIRRAWGWPNLLDLIGRLAEMDDEQLRTTWWNLHRNGYNPRP